MDDDFLNQPLMTPEDEAGGQLNPPPKYNTPPQSNSPPKYNTPSPSQSEIIAKKIVAQNSAVIPVKYRKYVYIGVGVFAAIVIIVVVTVVLLTRPSTTPTPTPTVTITTDPHKPKITQIDTSTTIPITFDSGGPTVTQLTLYPQNETNTAILIATLNTPTQFAVVNLTTNTQTGSVSYPITGQPNNKKISPYNTTSTNSVGAFVTNNFLNLFDVDVKDGKTTNLTEAKNIPPEELNNNTYITTTYGNPQNTYVIMLLPSTGQLMNIKTYLEDGTLIPELVFPQGLENEGVFSTMLYSSNQSFLTLLYFDQFTKEVVDVYIEAKNLSMLTIPLPGTGLGELISGATTENTGILMTVFESSVFIYEKNQDTRPVYVLQDFIHLSLDTDIHNCALDATGTWFMLSCTTNIFIIGKLNTDNDIDHDSLKYLDVTSYALINTNGPCSIQLSTDKTKLYALQADSADGLMIFVFSL